MKFVFILVSVFISTISFGQEGQEWKEASKESQAYHEARMKPTIPPHGLAKVRALIKKIKTNNDDMAAMDLNSYMALSLREKFTYHMIHAESYSQNCDATPPIQDEHKKIFANLPDAFDEYAWSERQTKFLSSNRDSVIAFMKESIGRSKRVGLNFKQVIIEINAWQMIPTVISTYNIAKKDHDLLTVLMLLMRDNEYEQFLASGSYKKLYSEEARYDAYLNFNKANADLIIKRATDFYNAVKK